MTTTELIDVLRQHDIPLRHLAVNGTMTFDVTGGTIILDLLRGGSTAWTEQEDFEPDLTPEVNDLLNRLTAITQGTLKLYDDRVYLVTSGKTTYIVDVHLTPIKKETPIPNRRTSTRQALIEALTTNMNNYERARMLITSELLGLHHPRKSFEVQAVSDSVTKYTIDGTVFKIKMFDRSTDLTNVKCKGAVSHKVQAAAARLLSQEAIGLITALGTSMQISQIVLSDNGVEYYFRIDDSVVFNILFLLEVANEVK